MKRILLLAIPALLIGAGVVATLVFGLVPVPGVTPLLGRPATPEPPKPVVTVMFPTKERVVNLSDPGTMRYLKVQATLEFVDTARRDPPKGDEVQAQQEAFAKEMQAYTAVLEDRLTTVLSAKTSADLQAAGGKERLKQEVADQINKALHEREKVVNVYFQTFIIQ